MGSVPGSFGLSRPMMSALMGLSIGGVRGLAKSTAHASEGPCYGQPSDSGGVSSMGTYLAHAFQWLDKGSQSEVNTKDPWFAYEIEVSAQGLFENAGPKDLRLKGSTYVYTYRYIDIHARIRI